MIVVVGLGNPGSRYEKTRHNVGFEAVSKAAAFLHVKLRKRCFRLYRQAKLSLSNGQQVLLVQPLTFMNASGNIMDSFNKDDTFVIACDNMDLAAGGLRIRQGGGYSGQKGLASIAEKLGRSDFLRIYIGIGRPQEGVDVPDHVLGTETDEARREAVERAICDAARAVMEYIDGKPVGQLQTEFNRKGLL